MKVNKFMQYVDPLIIETAFPTYPKWTKKQIKRKYKDKPVIYLDVWIPRAPRLCDLLPKKKVNKN